MGNKVNVKTSPEILSKIKQIEIFTRRLLSGSLVGDSRSAIKGTGLEFDQIREYAPGDDIRFIDWKSSARTNKLLVKQYFEERSRTIFLVVDVSKSSLFGSVESTKYDSAAQLASVLALVARYGKDRVGLLLFSDHVEQYIPPASSSHQARRIMEELFSHQPKHSHTKISVALQHLLAFQKKDALVFLISDFIDDEMDSFFAQAAKRYDLIAMRCLDVVEKVVPLVGFVTVEDIETGEPLLLDLRNKTDNKVKKFLATRIDEQNKIFKKYGVDLLDVVPSREHYIADIVRFFRRRMMY